MAVDCTAGAEAATGFASDFNSAFGGAAEATAETVFAAGCGGSAAAATGLASVLGPVFVTAVAATAGAGLDVDGVADLTSGLVCGGALPAAAETDVLPSPFDGALESATAAADLGSCFTEGAGMNFGRAASSFSPFAFPLS